MYLFFISPTEADGTDKTKIRNVFLHVACFRKNEKMFYSML